jgi:hypothetical protein
MHFIFTISRLCTSLSDELVPRSSLKLERSDQSI